MSAIQELKGFVEKKEKNLREEKRLIPWVFSMSGVAGLVAGLIFALIWGTIRGDPDFDYILAAIAFAGGLFGASLGSSIQLMCYRKIKKSLQEKIFVIAKKIMPGILEYESQREHVNNVRTLADALSGDPRARLERLLDLWEPIVAAKETALEREACEWLTKKRVSDKAFESVEALAAGDENDDELPIDRESLQMDFQEATRVLEARVETEAVVLKLPLPNA